MTISPGRYRTIAIAALVMLVAIVVTGAAVRLTGSGLGCSDWPNCNSVRFVDVSSKHAAIEQINRLFTGLVSAAVIAAVLGAFWRAPRRRDLIWLSVGLVAGVLAQALLGAVVVWAHLHPIFVQGHMLLSLVLVGLAVMLVQRAGEPDDGTMVRPVSPEIHRHVMVVMLGTMVAVLTGTVVTGAGPHAGDEDVERLGIDISSAARVHSLSVLVTVAVMVALIWRLQRRPAERSQLSEWVSAWVFVALLQGAIGYLQYFTDVPALLVGIHVFGATALWGVTVALLLRTMPLRRPAVSAPAPTAVRHPTRSVAG